MKQIPSLSRRQFFLLMSGATAYALLSVLGGAMEQSGTLSGLRAAVFAGRFLPAFLVALVILLFLLEFPSRLFSRKEIMSGGPKFIPLAAFLLMLACWAPMFLAEYPGSFQYDTNYQVWYIVKDAYLTHHPLLHTLFLKFCLDLYPLLQSLERCAAAYSILQMLLLSGCFTGVLCSIRQQAGNRAAWLSTLFFGLYPTHMAMASNCTKDVLFSGFFALFFTLIWETLRDRNPDPCRILWIIVSGTLSCLLRNNMGYAAAAFALLLFLFARPRRVALLPTAALLLSVGINTGLVNLTNAKAGSAVEMLSVPIQQLARARIEAPDAFTEEDSLLLDSYFEAQNWKKYDPTISDPVKFDILTDVLFSDPTAAFHLWKDVGLRCPVVYADAFAALTLPSWYPYRHYGLAQKYIETGLLDNVITQPFGVPPLTQPSRFAGIRAWLEKNLFENGAQGIPLLRELMNTGLVFWLFGFLLLRTLYHGDRAGSLALLLPLMLWGTLMLGPVMQGRYLYPFVCILPAALCTGRNTNT